ncbi:MAG: TonB-dependent receptor, partial [Treponema sp.]|nr:TonB-dependent receptor [Treponema sp.]
YQWADKGLSPPDINTREYAIWDWPVWNRHSLALNGVFSQEPFSMQGLFYFDKYDNRLDEYYTLKALDMGIHAPHSDYDEYALGGRLLGSWDIAENHRLQAALTYKRDDHRGLQGNITNDEVREVIHVNEDTWSAGFEYAVNPLRPLTIRAGLGFDALVPLEYWNEENEFLTLMEAGYFIVKTHNMFLFTWQTGAFYKITEDHELRLTYARKNHFPTMSDRYSTRFGSTLPNPNLGPEKANHFELGYRGDFFRELFDDSFLRVNTAFYYSIMEGKIVTVQLPNPHYPSALVDYSRNLDSVGFWGLELSPELTVKDWLSTGLTFSWNNYTLYHSQAGIKVMTYFPPITLNGYMVIKPVKFLSLIPRLEYISRRWSDTEGTMELDGYFLAHFKVSARIGSHWSVSLGVENIFDTYYEIRLNSPLAGRSFNLSALLAY